ncbi:MAG: threonine/serine exporter family protein [Myxococcota bacterium]|jgi:uncharacterized membrane protein YjjP (DUF1212 family)
MAENTAQTDEHEPIIGFMMKLAVAMQRYGAPAHKLEDLTHYVSNRLGIKGNIFAMNTVLMAAFGDLFSQKVIMHSAMSSGEINLDKQVRLYRVANDVVEGKTDFAQGERIIDQIVSAPPPYGSVMTTVCSALSSAAAARFFGGGWREIVVAGIGGVLIGVLGTMLSTSLDRLRAFEVVGSILVSILAAFGALLLGPLNTTITVLGGLVFLLPGFTVTVAMNELASRHMISGTSRLMGAITVLLVMGLGVTLGQNLASIMHVEISHDISIPLAPWTEWVALIVGLSSYVVLFKVPRSEAPYVIGAGVITYLVAWGASKQVDVDMATGCAAFSLGIMGNLYARFLGKPSAIPTVPGIMYLVPGSIGMKSLFQMIDRNTINAIEMAFQMSVLAMAIVTGLLLANVVIPPRRML